MYFYVFDVSKIYNFVLNCTKCYNLNFVQYVLTNTVNLKQFFFNHFKSAL